MVLTAIPTAPSMVVLVCSLVFTVVRFLTGKDFRTPAYGSGRVAGNLQQRLDPARSSWKRSARTCQGSHPAHLAAWAGLAPAMHESAGRQTPAGKRHGNKWLTAMLVEAAGSVGRMKGKNYLAAQHARLTKRRGMGRAQVAVAHSMLVSAYWMLTRDEPYHDLGADWHSRRSNEAHTKRLIAQLERLGHTVTLDPVA